MTALDVKCFAGLHCSFFFLYIYIYPKLQIILGFFPSRLGGFCWLVRVIAAGTLWCTTSANKIKEVTVSHICVCDLPELRLCSSQDLNACFYFTKAFKDKTRD